MNKLAALFAIALAAACGADNPNMNPDDPAANDKIAPTVLSMSPADGASGIQRDATVSIKFSEAMDQLSVQNSIDAADLGAVTFAWSDEGKTLRITPASALEYAEGTGSDPSLTPGLVHRVAVGVGALDEAGIALAQAKETNFTTLKRISHSLVRENAQTGSGTPSGVTTDEDDFLMVGDDDAGGLANGYRGYITMDLGGLPESTLEIESATLHSEQMFVAGNPYVALSNGNGLLLDHGVFELGANGNENHAFNLEPLGFVGEFAQADDVAISIDVRDALQDDLLNREARLDRSQFRLRFDAFTNLDNVADTAYIGRSELAINVVYLAP